MSKRIFISYSWKKFNVDDRNNIINILKNKKYFSFTDYSVDYQFPIEGTNNEVWTEIESRIKNSSIVLITAGVYATYSDSINKEIDIAKKYGKKIIAVRPYGAIRVSSIALESADRVVGHAANSIADAIKEMW